MSISDAICWGILIWILICIIGFIALAILDDISDDAISKMIGRKVKKLVDRLE